MKYCLHTIHWVLVLSRFDFRFDKIIKLVSNIILKFEEDKFIFKVNWHMLLEGCHFVKEKRSLFQSTTVQIPGPIIGLGRTMNGPPCQ